MKLIRRTFLSYATAAIASSAMPEMTYAQSYPTKPVRILVGFPANGPNSILAGIAAEWLSARLGQPFSIEHKPGRSGNIATAEAVKAPADGYTLLLCGPANAIGATLYPDLPYVFLRDMIPVAGITREALALVVHPDVPAKTVPELLALAKANPSSIKIASTGNGSAPHVTAELFKQMTGLNLNIVHYAGGGPALNAIVNGEAQMMFEPMSASIEPVRSGKLRALAVSTTQRSTALPEAPPLAQFVPGYEASAVTGIGVPKATPAEIVDRIHTEVAAGLVDARMKARFADLGGAPMPMTPAEFTRLIVDETEKWAKVIRGANLKPV